MTARILGTYSILQLINASTFNTSSIGVDSLNAIELSTGVISTASFWTGGPISSTTMGIGVHIGGTAINRVGVGVGAGQINQGANTVAIGYQAGYSSQGASSIAIGIQAGCIEQGIGAVAIGASAGYSSQGAYAVAIGNNAQSTAAGVGAVAIGTNAGQQGQGISSVAIGIQAGQINQGAGAVAIGLQAGQTNQGAYALAIGYQAGISSQTASSIIINAQNVSLNATSSGCYIAPIQLGNINDGILMYNRTTYEVTVGASFDASVGIISTVNANVISSVSITAGSIGLGATSSLSASVELFLTTDGSIKQTTTTWQTGSDVRIKTNIEPASLSICYSTINGLQLRRYTWDPVYFPIVEDRNVIGFISQEVEHILPKSILELPAYGHVDHKFLDVDQIYKMHIGATQAVSNELDLIESRINKLEQILSAAGC